MWKYCCKEISTAKVSINHPYIIRKGDWSHKHAGKPTQLIPFIKTNDTKKSVSNCLF